MLDNLLDLVLWGDHMKSGYLAFVREVGKNPESALIRTAYKWTLVDFAQIFAQTDFASFISKFLNVLWLG